MTLLTPKPSQVESWERLPSDWQNDERMDALFSLFKERDLNPVHYDAKMKFWSETIVAFCEDHGLLQIDIPTVVSRFRRKGKTPKCLDKIFEELIKQNRLITTTDYANAQQSSWLSWTVNKLASPLTSWLSGRTPVDQEVFVIKELVDVSIAESYVSHTRCSQYPSLSLEKSSTSARNIAVASLCSYVRLCGFLRLIHWYVPSMWTQWWELDQFCHLSIDPR